MRPNSMSPEINEFKLKALLTIIDKYKINCLPTEFTESQPFGGIILGIDTTSLEYCLSEEVLKLTHGEGVAQKFYKLFNLNKKFNIAKSNITRKKIQRQCDALLNKPSNPLTLKELAKLTLIQHKNKLKNKAIEKLPRDLLEYVNDEHNDQLNLPSILRNIPELWIFLFSSLLNDDMNFNSSTIPKLSIKNWTLLCYLAACDLTELFDECIKNGAQFISTNTNHNALFFACANGNIAMVNSILNMKNFNMMDFINLPLTHNQLTPLMAACQSGNLELVQLLVEQGAEINSVTAQGKSALIFAYCSGNSELVKYLENKDAKLILTLGLTIIDFMYIHATPGTLESFIKNNNHIENNLSSEISTLVNAIPTNELKATPFALACIGFNIPMIKFLLLHGKNPNSEKINKKSIDFFFPQSPLFENCKNVMNSVDFFNKFSETPMRYFELKSLNILYNLYAAIKDAHRNDFDNTKEFLSEKAYYCSNLDIPKILLDEFIGNLGKNLTEQQKTTLKEMYEESFGSQETPNNSQSLRCCIS